MRTCTKAWLSLVGRCRTMSRERLQRRMWTASIVFGLVGIAFVIGCMCSEPEEEPDPIAPDRTEIVGGVTMSAEPVVCAANLPQEPTLTLCEETYLRDDIPLSYELQCALYGACVEFGVDYALALAVVEQETEFQNVVGDGGDSAGYMQIQRKWWGDLMTEIGTEDLRDPEDNFRTGCAILRHLMDKHGNVEDALSAYNTGKPGDTRYSREVIEKIDKYIERD